jgi:hypothetical protein
LDGAATTHLRLWRREADLEGKGTDGGREHSRLRFCDVIAREGESVIGLRYEMTIVEKPERNLPTERLFFRLHVDDRRKVVLSFVVVFALMVKTHFRRWMHISV